MTTADRESLVRRYARGDITWRELREEGLEDDIEVQGQFGLRLPIARMEDPNVEARLRGQALIRERLRSRT